MRMAKKRLEDPARRFRNMEPLKTAKRSSKRAVNVSVDAQLLKVAKEMNINLSQTLERALDTLTAKERAQRFYDENKAAMDAHNAHIEKHGTSSEAYAREFGDDD